MDNIHVYLHTLLEQAGFTEEDNLEELIDDLEPLLLDRIISKMAEKLSEEDQNRMHAIIEKGQIEEFEALMHEKIADYDKYFDKVMKEFGDEYLAQFA